MMTVESVHLDFVCIPSRKDGMEVMDVLLGVILVRGQEHDRSKEAIDPAP